MSIELEPIRRLTKDRKQAAATLSVDEARYLVDAYYQLQRDRIRSDNQVRALTTSGEPHDTIAWLAGNAATLERDIKAALDVYGDAHVVGRWSKTIVGIGPVLSAGLLAHITIAKAPTVGHIWRFAGLDPTVTWEKKHKRPWNASLKTLCWKIGESFVKVSGHEDDVYGHLYLERKAREISKNEAGDFAAQAAAIVAKGKIAKNTEAWKSYAAGRLPPGHLHARAKRWAVKLFLAHYHHVAFVAAFGTAPPRPYVMTHLHHAHEIRVPHWPLPE